MTGLRDRRIATAGLMAGLLIAVAACGGRVTPPEPTAEELRLIQATRIDTTTLRTILNPEEVEGWERLDSLSAEAWLLIDDDTGWVISEKNADRRLYMASLTKMMTALLTIEHNQPGDTIRLTRELCPTGDARVRPGDTYQEGDLLCEMMLLSDNDAAYALACHIGGDEQAFCQRMNEKAAYLHMDSTHFANPNGMPNDSNYSTARDLARLARYCMRDSAFALIAGSAFRDVPLADGRHLPCQNTNQLLTTYDGCIGVKTGYTRQAGSCLASAATRDGITLHLILLNSRSHQSRFDESAALLDYGFCVVRTAQQRKK